MTKKASGELKIEKGIEMPTARGKGYSAALRLLKVGDSVVLPTKISNASGICQRAMPAHSYACRTVEGGTRVWRIK